MRSRIDKEISQELYEQIYQLGVEDEREKIKKIIENLEYNSQAEGCGLEDKGITDRYEAMEYGRERAINSMLEEL